MISLDKDTMQNLWDKTTDGYLPILLEIYNPDISWTEEEKRVHGQDNCYVRFISDENKVIYKSHTWLPCSFEYTPPETDGNKIGSASISITALDLRVKKLIKSIRSSCEVKVIASFMKQEKETSGKFIYKFVELNSMPFEMNTASSDRTKASFNLVFKTSMAQNVPFDIATQDRTPSITA